MSFFNEVFKLTLFMWIAFMLLHYIIYLIFGNVIFDSFVFLAIVSAIVLIPVAIYIKKLG